jgi:asparagine synthase (glutamine-hydrolysing)
MCGICGIINFNKKPVDESLIFSLMNKIKHRGPDDEGIYIDNNFGFGFVRLSILDLSSLGHQPMFDCSNRFMILHNGEVYNYIEIREILIKKGYKFKSNTDTEVILYSFIEWGEDCLDMFNGMWSFVIYDTLEKKLFASRDRFGVKPFYYLKTDDFFAFASEIPPLLELLNGKPTPNYQAIFDFLKFNRTDYSDETFFQDIKKLKHGNKLKIIDNKVIIEKWYDLKYKVNNNNGIKNPLEFKNLLIDSIKLRMRSDVPVGVCLSGGLDSSSITSILIHNFNQNDIRTFSAIYGKGEYGDESEYINEFSKHLKNMYYVIPTADTLYDDLLTFVKIHAEPIPDTAPYSQFKVMELAKSKNVVVLLNGQGADEILAGYHYFFGFYFFNLLKDFHLLELTTELVYYLLNHKSLYGIESFLFLILPNYIKRKINTHNKNYISEDFFYNYINRSEIFSYLYQSKNLNDYLIDHFEYKLEHLLKWEDINSMYFSLESRLPFLDYRLVEKTIASDTKFKINKGRTKSILRIGLKDILPEKISLRNGKIGFGNPQNNWFRQNKLRNFINEILNSESLKNRKIINTDIAKKIYLKHLKREINAAKEIWKLLHLELWFREFID